MKYAFDTVSKASDYVLVIKTIAQIHQNWDFCRLNAKNLFTNFVIEKIR